MKLTYTLEFDVRQDHGPDVPADRVSAAVINDLIRQFTGAELTVLNTGDDATTFAVHDCVVWPHEDSVPNRMAMAPREKVDRVPVSQPAEDARAA